MADPAIKPARYQDLFDLPEHVVGEIVNGELYAQPRPAGPHALAASTLGIDIGAPFQRGRGGPGGWWIVDEPELHLDHQILVPDIAGWQRHRLPTIPDAPFFELAPDWVCEVISPSTAQLDRVRKLPIYAEYGVAYAWLVDPQARTLEVFQLVDGHWQLQSTHSDDEIVRAVPFDAVALELAALWGE